MEFENYKEELELINNLNPYEEEMYPVLWHVIRGCISDENLTLRNVSADRQSVKLNTYNFMSESRFPDFVILGKDYDPFQTANRNNPAISKIYGAVEIKLIGEEGELANITPITVNFEIERADVSEAVVSRIPNQTLKGAAVRPIPKVKVGRNRLKGNRDFTVSYLRNGVKGEATAIIKGVGNYTGECRKTFIVQ